jgi:hypothetical protein
MITLQEILHYWSDFFFKPVPVYTVAVFRIVFSLILLIEAFYILLNLKEYLGPKGLIDYERYYKRSVRSTFSLFLYLPPTMSSVYLIMAIHIVALVFMAIGLLTPISVIVSFITLRSIINRNPIICNGGDNVARIMCFFLIFSSSGHAYSLDEHFFYSSTETGNDYLMQSPWAVRLMQIQISVIYLYTAYWKLKGHTYRNGTAMYYVMENHTYRRFPLGKILLSTPFVQLLTWGALVIEFSLGALIWIQDLRYAMIFMGCLLHLTIEYILNVHLFGWYMMASLLLFVNPDDMRGLVHLFFT